MANDPDKAQTEIWKAVTGFHGAYEVSSCGRVRALRRMVSRGSRGVCEFPERILTAKKRGPYVKVQLHLSGAAFSYTIHRLVCEAFHGPRPSVEHEVAHWDGDPLNNNSSNLRWATKVENAADRKRHGRNQIGERNCNNKMTVKDIYAIRALSEMGWSGNKIASIFPCSSTNIRNILTRKIWGHIN